MNLAIMSNNTGNDSEIAKVIFTISTAKSIKFAANLQSDFRFALQPKHHITKQTLKENS